MSHEGEVSRFLFNTAEALSSDFTKTIGGKWQRADEPENSLVLVQVDVLRITVGRNALSSRGSTFCPFKTVTLTSNRSNRSLRHAVRVNELPHQFSVLKYTTGAFFLEERSTCH